MRILATLVVPGLLTGCAASHAVEPDVPRAGFVEVDDSLRIAYWVYGDGDEKLVLLHGGPGANSMGVGPDLVPWAEKHTFIRYDQRGGGHSDPDPNAAGQTAATHVSDLETLRRHLGSRA